MPSAVQAISVADPTLGGGLGNAASGMYYSPSISPDGRYAAFASSASNLVPGDTNGAADIFVRDTLLGTTTRVSTDSSGTQGNQDSIWPSLALDGSGNVLVAFVSYASNLVASDTNTSADVFVKNLTTNVTTRVNTDSNGIQGDMDSSWPSLAVDGSGNVLVAFGSYADNLVGGDTNQSFDVFVKNLANNVTTRVSTDSSGSQSNSHSYYPSLAFDHSGTAIVAFSSHASNLVANDANGTDDVFVKNLTSNVTTCVSIDSSGTPGNDGSSLEGSSLAVDGNGNVLVAFFGSASNLVADDTNQTTDVFVKNLTSNVTTRVSTDSNGNQSNSTGTSTSTGSSLAVDGGGNVFVAFESSASNLVTGDSNASFDVFVKNLTSNVTTRASTDSSGTEGNGNSLATALAVDGSGNIFVAFDSAASNLVSGDTNAATDVFLWTLPPPTPLPDIIATDLAFNRTQGGVDFSYQVTGADLSADTSAALYWADAGANVLSVATNPITVSAPRGNDQPIHVAAADLSVQPAAATQLLLVLDPPDATHPHGLIEESDEGNNSKELASPDIAVMSASLKNLTNVEFTYKVAGNPGTFQASIYRSADLNFDAGDELIVMTNVTPSSTNPQSHVTISLGVPLTDDPSYHYLIVVDPQDAVSETNEGNNTAILSLPGVIGDAYEPDDTPDQANTIPSDGSAQYHSLNVKTDVDWVAFTLVKSSNVTIETDGVTGGDTRMWLYRGNGQTIQFNDNSGNGNYSKIVRSGDNDFLPAGAYLVKVDSKGRHNQISAYSIRVTAAPVMHGLLGLATRDIGSIPVAIQPFNSLRTIDPNRTTWVVIHGRASSPYEDYIVALANAIKHKRSDQILMLDWSQGAKATSEVDFTGEDWIQPVARWAAAALQDIGFGSLGRNLKLNLIGHSWGAYVADEVAERIPGGVNSIVALDPPFDVLVNSPPLPLIGGGVYDPDGVNTDGKKQIDFAAHSATSWVFSNTTWSVDPPHFPVDSIVTPLTADETYNVQDSEHTKVVSLFSYFLLFPNRAISQNFHLSRLLSHEKPARLEVNRYNREGNLGNADHSSDFDFGYEAVLTAPGGGMVPDKLTYFDSVQRKEVTVRN